MRNEIKILCMYDELLDLYGDFGNVRMIKMRLEEMGLSCSLVSCGLGETPDFDACDMLYIGPGKGRSLVHAAKHLIGYAAPFRAAIERGLPALVTGSARLLLGKGFRSADGEDIPCVGLFDYTGYDDGKVFVSDVVGELLIDGAENTAYGFINRTAHIEGSAGSPLLRLKYGAGDGSGPSSVEGSIYKNLVATWCLGPLLVKNPALLRLFLKRLAGDAFVDYDDSLEKKALALTLHDMEKDLASR